MVKGPSQLSASFKFIPGLRTRTSSPTENSLFLALSSQTFFLFSAMAVLLPTAFSLASSSFSAFYMTQSSRLTSPKSVWAQDLYSNWIGVTGSNSCLAIKRVMRVALHGELRIKYKAMGTTEAQLPYFYTNLATMVFRVL